MTTEITINNNKYRIKKMNALEVLAFRGRMTLLNDSVEETTKIYEEMLSQIEVNINDKWLQVKQGSNYYPAGLEDDFETIEQLVLFMVRYLKEVFQKSNELKSKTE